MNLSAIKNDDGEIIMIDIDFKCKNCNEPVRMRFHTDLTGIKRQMFLDQAHKELCQCDYNGLYQCFSNTAEKFVEIMGK
jgi:hypothetical protein